MASFGHARSLGHSTQEVKAQQSRHYSRMGWRVLRNGLPTMDGTRWSLLRRLTDHIWMPVLGAAVAWTFNTASETSAVRAYDLSKAERVVHTQCWMRVVELTPSAETIARRSPQEVCGCAVAGARRWAGSPDADVLDGLLGDAVNARRLWIEPRRWSAKRMRPVITVAVEGTGMSTSAADAELKAALSSCG